MIDNTFSEKNKEVVTTINEIKKKLETKIDKNDVSKILDEQISELKKSLTKKSQSFGANLSETIKQSLAQISDLNEKIGENHNLTMA